ncbi:outer membrane lipid asymmetry maintenance protein MlaD [Arsenophonus symbiont of Ornithomya chloropus]|uniref:outer membrane lipid asymmetry maintenance protein MlaD n=1 Tax=Arsenophonus symbiont of Ornithomya chloropus TaxID=634121 RepID=UPI0032B246D1
MQNQKNEILVGLFFLIGLSAFLFLCWKVANIKSFSNQRTYKVTAIFSNIGGLKINSPVKIGGVVVGRIVDIILDKKTYNPRVTLAIFNKYNNIPDNSSLSILTAGLLGEQFLALNVGFYDSDMDIAVLKNGDHIEDTKSAIVLEDLIGQFFYKGVFPKISEKENNVKIGNKT